MRNKAFLAAVAAALVVLVSAHAQPKAEKSPDEETIRKGAERYCDAFNSGDLDALRAQIGAARNAGVDTVMVQPMIMGLSNFARLAAENRDMAFFAHPTLAGAARIAPQFLFGKVFRMLGADALVFPNHGGRFGYTPETCRAIAETALAEWHGLKPAVPVPAGGMTTNRVGEMLDFYGSEVMLLIGGALLDARERLTEATAAFVETVKGYRYG